MGIKTAKHTFYILGEPQERRMPDGRLHKTDYTVLFMHSDRKGLRAKAGILSVPFTERYGISVFATYDGERHWNQTGGDLELMQALSTLFEKRELPLPILSETTINQGRTW